MDLDLDHRPSRGGKPVGAPGGRRLQLSPWERRDMRQTARLQQDVLLGEGEGMDKTGGLYVLFMLFLLP